MSFESVRNLGGNDLLKALAELQGLKVDLVTGATANTAIPVALIDPEDTIIAIHNLTDLTAVDLTHVTIKDRRAVGTMTIGADLADGDAISVNGKVYTFREMTETIAMNVGPGIVPFDADPSGANVVAVTAARLAKVIMSNDSTLSATAALGVVTIRFRVAGTGGNKTLSDTAANGHVTKSGATMTDGTATHSFSVSDSTAAKKLQVFWYDKTP